MSSLSSSKEGLKNKDLLNIVKESRAKSYGLTVFNIAVIIILIIGAIRPTLITISRVRNEIKTKEIILDRLNSKRSALQAIDSQFSLIQADLNNLQLIFPEGRDFSLMLSNFEVMSSQRGFELTSVSFDESRDISFSNILLISEANLTIVGDQTNLIPFIKDIENLPMYPQVTGLAFATTPDEDGNLVFSLTVNFYSVKESNFYI